MSYLLLKTLLLKRIIICSFLICFSFILWFNRYEYISQYKGSQTWEKESSQGKYWKRMSNNLWLDKTFRLRYKDELERENMFYGVTFIKRYKPLCSLVSHWQWQNTWDKQLQRRKGLFGAWLQGFPSMVHCRGPGRVESRGGVDGQSRSHNGSRDWE